MRLIQAVVILTTGIAGSAFGFDRFWSAPTSGKYEAAASWTGGVPPLSAGIDRVLFETAGTYDVQFDAATETFYGGSPRVTDVLVSAGDLSLITSGGPRRSLLVDGPGGDGVFMSGGTLNLGSPDVASEAFQLATSVKVDIQSGQVNVWPGSELFSNHFLDVGNATGASGTLLVTGAGANVIAPGIGSRWGRNGGTATVTFENGATADLGTIDFAGSSAAGTSANVEVRSGAVVHMGSVHLAVAGGATTSANLNVQGTGSSIIQDLGTLNVGHPTTGTAALNIGTTTGGGTFTTFSHTTIDKTGTVNVGAFPNTGSLNLNGNLTITGGKLNVSPNSTLTLAAGPTVNIVNGGVLSIFDEHTTPQNSTYTVRGAGSKLESTFEHIEVHNGSTVNVSSGGRIQTATWIRVGNTGNGTLNVDGVDTIAQGTQSGTHWWGSNGNTANVTFSNGATGIFGAIEMARTSTAGTTANINVLSGAVLNASTLRLVQQGGATTSGTLNVQGPGSTVTQHAVGDLTIGSFSDGAAMVNIGTTQSGAVFTAGGGNLNINRMGKVFVGGPSSTGSLNLQNDLFVRGELQVRAGSAVNVPVTKAVQIAAGASLLDSGTLKGGGTIYGAVRNDGLVGPGTPIGTLTINGNFTQFSFGTLEIEIGSPTSADKLVVNGNAALGGQLWLRLVDGYVPEVGASFDIIDWTTKSGSISQFQYLALPSGRDWDFSQVNTTGVISVRSTLAGDYNSNGAVDAADYVVWRNSFGAMGPGLAADGNQDNKIDEMDYGIWKTHFGESAGSGATTATGTSIIPEPGSGLFALSVLVVCGAICRHRPWSR